MWSGKKKKGSAEDFFKDEDLDLELTGGRKRDKEKEEKEKRKKEKEEKKEKDKDKEGHAGGVGLFQRKHKKSVGSTDIDLLRVRERDKEKEKDKEKGAGRVFHRRNKSSSSSSSGDPSAAAVVATAASRLNVSTPERDGGGGGGVTRLGIKRETFSPTGTLNLNSGLLSSFPPPSTTSPRGGASPRNPLGNSGPSAGTQSGPMAPLPQLADVSHKRKNSVDEVSPRFLDSTGRALAYADAKQPIPISEMLKRSPITSPRSPSLAREMTEQQRQILAQAHKKLQLELLHSSFTHEREPPTPSSKDRTKKIHALMDEWDEAEDVNKDQSLRDKLESEEWGRERRAKQERLCKTANPTSALGKYLVARWQDQAAQSKQPV